MALVCEICGGSNFIKKDGAFECQGCGCKYSAQEARTLMSGGASVSAPAPVAPPADNSARIDNMMKNAKSTYDAGNYKLAFNQYNEVLNIEPDNHTALFYKGLSAGMQSSVAEPRVSEAANYANQSMEILIRDDAEKIDIKNDSLKGFVFFTVMSKRLSEIMTLNDLCESMYLNYAKKRIDSITQRTRSLNNYDLGYEYLSQQMRELKREMNTETTFLKEKRSDCIISIGTVMIPFLVFVLKSNNFDLLTNDSCWKLVDKIKDWADHRLKEREYNQTAKTTLSALIDSCEKFKKRVIIHERQVKEAEQRAANETYWKEHQQEKQELEAEKNKLKKEINRKSRSLENITQELNQNDKKRRTEIQAKTSVLNDEVRNLTNEIDGLRVTMNKLGVFKKKEKQALQLQIDEKNTRIVDLKAKIGNEENQVDAKYHDKAAELRKRKTELTSDIQQKKKRLDEINTKLTKSR